MVLRTKRGQVESRVIKATGFAGERAANIARRRSLKMHRGWYAIDAPPKTKRPAESNQSGMPPPPPPPRRNATGSVQAPVRHPRLLLLRREIAAREKACWSSRALESLRCGISSCSPAAPPHRHTHPAAPPSPRPRLPGTRRPCRWTEGGAARHPRTDPVSRPPTRLSCPVSRRRLGPPERLEGPG